MIAPELAPQQHHALIRLLDYLKQQKYAFVTITPVSHQRIFTRYSDRLAQQRNLRDIFGWNLPFQKDALPLEMFDTLKEARLIHQAGECWVSNVRVAALESELFIHSAFPTVDQDAVFFGPDSYRFIYHLKKCLQAEQPALERCVELCCGASPAAIALAKWFPQIRESIAVDINPKALFCSQINAEAAGLTQVYTVNSNLLNDLHGDFDLIVANPPYLMDSEQRQYRHGGDMLDGAGLSFSILEQAIKRLNPNGLLFLYTGIAISEQGNRFLQVFESWIALYPFIEWEYEEVDPDVFGEELDQPVYQHIERIAVVIIKLRMT
jgi:methylase of polypeptide subunit release factors